MGQNVNLYRFDNSVSEIAFPDLLGMVAKAEPNMRIRFATLQPKDMSGDTLKVMAANANLFTYQV